LAFPARPYASSASQPLLHNRYTKGIRAIGGWPQATCNWRSYRNRSVRRYMSSTD